MQVYVRSFAGMVKRSLTLLMSPGLAALVFMGGASRNWCCQVGDECGDKETDNDVNSIL